MGKKIKKISSLLLPAILVSCGSVPRTIGPYIETEFKNKPQPQQTQTYAQNQQQPKQSQQTQVQVQQQQQAQTQPQPQVQPQQQQAQTQPQVQSQQQQPQTQAQVQQPQQQAQTKVQVQQPQQQAQTTQQQNYGVRDDVFRAVSVSDASRIETYNIVVGSFSLQDNATKLAKSISSKYNPIIIINEKGMYRVIIASFNSYEMAKEDLVKSIKNKYPDAWILTQKK